MKDVRTVLVDVDPFDALGVDVAGDVWALVDDEDSLALPARFVGKNSAVYQVILQQLSCLPYTVISRLLWPRLLSQRI